MGLRQQQVETFADDTPLGADGQPVQESAPAAPQANPNVPQTEQKQPDTVDSFDGPDMTEEEMQAKLAEMKKDDKEDSQVTNLDEEEDEKEEEKEKQAKVDDDEEEDDGEDQDEDTDDTDTEPDDGKPRGRPLRVKDGDKRVDLSQDATVPVRINGKKEFVSIKDLRDNYSGQVVWQERMDQAKSAKEDAEYLYEKTVAERDEIKGHLGTIASMLDDDKVDPLKPLMYLVEMSGRNVLDYTKKVYSSMENTIHELDSMDDVERQLYWTKRENQFIKDNQATKTRLSEQANAEKERYAKVDQLRESRGVSEEQFVEAYEDLMSLGYNEDDITPEAVVNYSAMRPHYDRSEGLCSQFEEELSSDDMDALVDTVARTSQSYPNLSDEKILEIAAESLGWELDTEDSDIEELNSKTRERKAPEPSTYKYKQTPEGHVESFDDFDNDLYGRNYG